MGIHFNLYLAIQMYTRISRRMGTEQLTEHPNFVCM